jgi:hypothetical protein
VLNQLPVAEAANINHVELQRACQNVDHYLSPYNAPKRYLPFERRLPTSALGF